MNYKAQAQWLVEKLKKVAAEITLSGNGGVDLADPDLLGECGIYQEMTLQQLYDYLTVLLNDLLEAADLAHEYKQSLKSKIGMSNR